MATPWESVLPNLLAGDAPHVAELPMDNDAFAGFYSRSARPLWAYLARVSGDPALADDLMQESYVRYLCASQPASLALEGEVAARRKIARLLQNQVQLPLSVRLNESARPESARPLNQRSQP
jgi:RNA polymerase sigma-70 factor (ECF subfamily)